MKYLKYTYIAILLLLATGCAEEWLDIKQDKSMIVPQSLDDLQALMSFSDVVNFSSTPKLGVLGADNFYLQEEDWQSLSSNENKNAYIWAEDIYEGNSCSSWNNPYHVILLSNIVFEGLENIRPTEDEQEQWNQVKGTALFHRSWMFFQLAQVFCKQYDPTTAADDLGIPLKLESDVNLISTRSTIQQVYDQIIKDAQQATTLLPDNTVLQTRPGKVAAFGLLAKTYLQMSLFEESLKAVNRALDINPQLSDYNSLDSLAHYPFHQFNKEVIYHCTMYAISQELNTMHISEDLLSSYRPGDLRRSLYYVTEDNRTGFRGSYDGSSRPFSGLATDELYLIKAECEARLNQSDQALTTLNTLLETRWKQNEFIPYSLANDTEVLSIVLTERRKSLPFRGIRWADLRRLNREADKAIKMERVFSNQTYQLLPKSNRYTFPIPDEVIAYSGMKQNPR